MLQIVMQEVAITADLAAAAAVAATGASERTGSSSSSDQSAVAESAAKPKANQRSPAARNSQALTHLTGTSANSQPPSSPEGSQKRPSSPQGNQEGPLGLQGSQTRPSSPQLPKAPKSALLRQRSQSVPTSPFSPSRVTFQPPNSSDSHSKKSPFAEAASLWGNSGQRTSRQGASGQGISEQGISGEGPARTAQSPAQQLKAEPGDHDTMPGNDSPPEHHERLASNAGPPSDSVAIPGRHSENAKPWQNGFGHTASSVAGSSPGGISPPDGYLADSEPGGRGRSPSPVIMGGRSPSPVIMGGRSPSPVLGSHMPSATGFQMSLCGTHLTSSTRYPSLGARAVAVLWACQHSVSRSFALQVPSLLFSCRCCGCLFLCIDGFCYSCFWHCVESTGVDTRHRSLLHNKTPTHPAQWCRLKSRLL